MVWQWHQLDHMQIICTLLQTDNHASTSPLSFYRPDALLAAQPTASKHITNCSQTHLLLWLLTVRHFLILAVLDNFEVKVGMNEGRH